MSRVTSTAEHFDDANLAQTKATHVLEWVKRRVREAFQGETSSVIGDSNQESPVELLGDRGHLVRALFGSEDILEQTHAVCPLLSLRVEAVRGGATNIAARVWSVQASCPLGVFVKIGFPYLRWAKRRRHCPISRFDREFFGLKRLDLICPGVTSVPVMCGSDEVEDDGSRYLVIEHLPLHYEKYVLQFQKGTVDVRPAQALGFTLAKLHVQSPRRFHGRDGVYDVEMHNVTMGFYERVTWDMEEYLKCDDFKDMDTVRNFWMPDIAPISAQKHLCMLRNRPEILRAVSRQLDNFRHPPPETATFICVDSHVLNILVSSIPSSYPHSHDHKEYDPGQEKAMKLIDMEFYNWGPSGADFGMFLASAFFYALVFSYSGDALCSSDTMIQAITEGWKAYRKSYISHARQEKNRTDCSISTSLYRIVHEILGWAGTWICRFASPSLFPRICLSDFLYPLPHGLEENLASCISLDTGEDGFESLRSAVMDVAVSCLIVGFGDETFERFTADNDADGRKSHSLESCNEVMEKFTNELIRRRNELHDLLRKCSRHPP